MPRSFDLEVIHHSIHIIEAGSKTFRKRKSPEKPSILFDLATCLAKCGLLFDQSVAPTGMSDCNEVKYKLRNCRFIDSRLIKEQF